jgi:hypothetical protein
MSAAAASVVSTNPVQMTPWRIQILTVRRMTPCRRDVVMSATSIFAAEEYVADRMKEFALKNGYVTKAEAASTEFKDLGLEEMEGKLVNWNKNDEAKYPPIFRFSITEYPAFLQEECEDGVYDNKELEKKQVQRYAKIARRK